MAVVMLSEELIDPLIFIDRLKQRLKNQFGFHLTDMFK